MKSADFKLTLLNEVWIGGERYLQLRVVILINITCGSMRSGPKSTGHNAYAFQSVH
jgi:hypothetical protein